MHCRQVKGVHIRPPVQQKPPKRHCGNKKVVQQQHIMQRIQRGLQAGLGGGGLGGSLLPVECRHAGMVTIYAYQLQNIQQSTDVNGRKAD